MAFSPSFIANSEKSSNNKNLLENLKQINDEESRGKRSIVLRSVPLDYDENAIWNMCSLYGKVLGMRCKEYNSYSMFFIDYATTR